MTSREIVLMSDAELSEFLVPLFVEYVKKKAGFVTSLEVMNDLFAEVVNQRELIRTIDKDEKDLVVNRIYAVLSKGERP